MAFPDAPSNNPKGVGRKSTKKLEMATKARKPKAVKQKTVRRRSRKESTDGSSPVKAPLTKRRVSANCGACFEPRHPGSDCHGKRRK